MKLKDKVQVLDFALRQQVAVLDANEEVLFMVNYEELTNLGDIDPKKVGSAQIKDYVLEEYSAEIEDMLAYKEELANE